MATTTKNSALDAPFFDPLFSFADNYAKNVHIFVPIYI